LYVFYRLQALQHRGQESAGIAMYDSKTDSQKIHKQIGTVVEVFNQNIIASLQGNMGVGHTRYSTVGGSGVENIQPMSIAWETGGECVLAHNGTINNASGFKRRLCK
jgi:amidophosphoribosyltransferase